MIIDFSSLQTKLLLEGLITQTVIPCNAEENIQKGDLCCISFDGIHLQGYALKVENVTITNIGKLSSKDIFNNGFLYKPFFLDFVKQKGMSESTTIRKIDFEIVKL